VPQGDQLQDIVIFLEILLSHGSPRNNQMFQDRQQKQKYRAKTNTCLELTWLRYILQDLKVPQVTPTELFCDNQAILHIAANPLFHECTKHIEIDCHIVR